MNFLGEPQDAGPMTFAEPQEGLGFTERLKSTVDTALKFTPGAIARSITTDIIEGKDFGGLYNAAERQTRLVDNIVSHQSAIEEAYQRRIEAVKEATGVELDNPERLRLTERELRQINRDGPVDPAAWKRQQFDQKLAETRNQHPDAVDALTFGNIDQEARAIAKGAEDEYEQAKKDTNLSGASSLVAEFGGGFKGMLRDPLFVGSMFAGPTTAVGKTVGARILTSGLFQGLYNAGLSALEQPSVQAWRAEIGARSGAVPAVENVGLAFLFGAIPGVGFRAIHEIPAGARPAVQRVLAGTPEAGDLDQVMKVAKDALGEIDRDIPGLGPREAAAIKLGEEMDTADRITRPPAPSTMETPPVADGFVRFYHGGHDPGGGGGRWTTTDPEYARNFRAAETGPNEVHYVDIPKGDATEVAARGWDEIDESAGTNMVGRYRHTEIPEEWAKRMQPLQTGEAARLHDDLAAAALKRADDPAAPSPEAVAMVSRMGAAEAVDRPPPHEDGLGIGWSLDPERAAPPPGPSIISRTEFRPFGPSEEMGVKTLSIGDEMVATADVIRHSDGSLTIQKIETLPDARRRGYATELVRDIADEFPGAEIRTSMRTRQGSAFFRAAFDSESGNVPLEVRQRVAEAQPQTRAEAATAASEALEDIGNRDTIARVRTEMERDRLPAVQLSAEKELNFPASPDGQTPASTGTRYRITDDRGAGRGVLDISEQGKNLEVVWIGGEHGEHIDIGPANVRHLFRELKRLHPGAETISGDRISGVHRKPGQEVQEVKVPLNPPARSKDPLDKIPMSRDDGTPTAMSPQQLARVGERETHFADIIRECK